MKTAVTLLVVFVVLLVAALVKVERARTPDQALSWGGVALVAWLMACTSFGAVFSMCLRGAS